MKRKERFYQCVFCGLTGESISWLRYHQKKVHPIKWRIERIISENIPVKIWDALYEEGHLIGLVNALSEIAEEEAYYRRRFQAAVNQQRERDAKIAEEQDRTHGCCLDTQKEIAATIRENQK